MFRFANDYVTIVSCGLLLILLVFDYLRDGNVIEPKLQFATSVIQDLEETYASISKPSFVLHRELAENEETKMKAIWLSSETATYKELGYASYISDGDSEKLQKELATLQSSPCDSKILLFYHHQNNGFGAEFHWLQVALTIAYMTNRRLVVAEKSGWHYADEKDCNHTTWSCYFDSIPSCPLSLPNRRQIPLVDYSNLDQNDQYVVFSDTNRTVWEWIPPSYKHKSLFWWRSQLAHFLFLPKSTILEQYHQVKAQMYLDAQIRVFNKYQNKDKEISYTCESPIISVNLRHGDKVFGSKYNKAEMRYISLYESLSVAKNFWKLETQYHCLLLATRNPDVIKRVTMDTQDLLNKNVIVLFNSFQKRSLDFATIDLMEKRLNATQEMLDTIFDLLFMLDGDKYIAMTDSNLSRMVLELGAMKWKDSPVAFEGPGWYVNP